MFKFLSPNVLRLVECTRSAGVAVTQRLLLRRLAGNTHAAGCIWNSGLGNFSLSWFFRRSLGVVRKRRLAKRHVVIGLSATERLSEYKGTRETERCHRCGRRRNFIFRASAFCKSLYVTAVVCRNLSAVVVKPKV